MSCAEFYSETSNHPGDSAPLKPRFVTLQLLAFPQTKITFEREEIQENTTGQWMAIGTVWGSKVSTWKGTEVSLSCVQCFLYLASSSVNLSLFHSTWLDIFWTDLTHTYTHTYQYGCGLWSVSRCFIILPFLLSCSPFILEGGPMNCTMWW